LWRKKRFIWKSKKKSQKALKIKALSFNEGGRNLSLSVNRSYLEMSLKIIVKISILENVSARFMEGIKVLIKHDKLFWNFQCWAIKTFKRFKTIYCHRCLLNIRHCYQCWRIFHSTLFLHVVDVIIKSAVKLAIRRNKQPTYSASCFIYYTFRADFVDSCHFTFVSAYFLTESESGFGIDMTL
jgi:hypothetical protein